MQPSVTAVITTYRRPINILERALKSVVNQTYNQLDIIVVNDYPDDKLLVEKIGQVVEKYREKREIQYLIVKKNEGACKARNLALAVSNSKYIAFLDDDDEWLSNKIALQVKMAENHPDAAIIYCNSYIKVNGKKYMRFKKEQPNGDLFIPMIGENIIGSCTFPLLRVDIMRNVKGFREDMPALQDWELYLRILKKNNQVVYIHKPLAIYYFHEGDRISTNPIKRIKAYEKIHNEFKSDIEKYKKAASDFYLMGTYFYSFSDKRRAFFYYIRGACCNPLNVKKNIKDFFRMAGRGIIKTKKV